MRVHRLGSLKSALVLALVGGGSLTLGSAAAATAGPVAPAPTATQAPLTAAQAAALSTNVTDKVIVVFRNQFSATPDTRADEAARAADVNTVQSPVVNELNETHAQDIKRISLVNAVAATVSPGEAERLAANPAVSEVVPDDPIPLVGGLPTVKSAAGTPGSAPDIAPLPGACSAKGTVQLDPQAIETIHAASQSGTGDNAQALGYTGAGVTVAFIADGLDIDNPDFIRADGQHVFVDYQDFSGTGTSAPTDGGEAFLDSSSIAAQGLHTYNIASYGEGLSRPCSIRILGVAPGASLVGLNVFGSSNEAFNSVFLEAINYAVNVDHVNVLNESFGSNPFPDTASLDLTKEADDAAVAAGVTVTVSSGDAGVTNTIGSPATDPNVISAGASTTYRAYAQSGIGGITLPGVHGWLNNNISGLSSAGFDQTGATVDVVAPGDLNWALCSPDPAAYAACTNFSGQPASVELSGGTSEAAPLTAGVAALVIQAFAESHGGTAPTPAQVKQIITSTAQDIDAPADQQGAGMLDAYQAVLAAKSYPGATGAAQGSALLTSAAQLNAVGQPDSAQQLTETVTNDGAAPVTLAVSSRTLGAYTTVSSTTVSIEDATNDIARVRFTVHPGQARLNASIAYTAPTTNSQDFGANLNLSLISPSGKLAEYNLPQGTGNYGNAQVADPQAGMWTAYIYGAPSADGGTTGPVRFEAQVAPWTSFGTLSASSLTLAPGASGPVTLDVSTPAQPGDVAGSIQFTDHGSQPSFAAVTSVPVTLRSLVPTPSPSSTFTGTLTGGNGRQASTGQTAYYQVQIPDNTAALNVEVSTPNADNSFLAELIDPGTGEAASTAANSLLSVSGSGTDSFTPEQGAQLHVVAPDAGLWTLVVDFYNQVSGTAVSQPFTVSMTSTPVGVTETGLPASASTSLPVGRPLTVPVTVTNSGTSPEEYFVDARLESSTSLPLAAVDGDTLAVPVTGAPAEYLVPSHTTGLTATVTAPAPVFFDFWSLFGDPDIASSSPFEGKTAGGSLTSAAVAPGIWGVTPFQKGPDGPGGVKSVTATTSLTATTLAFDPAVSSPTGDLWAESTNPSAPFTPYLVQPGQSVTIPVTITPTTPGSVVSGVLYVDDASLVDAVPFGLPSGISPQSSDVAAIPYQYSTP